MPPSQPLRQSTNSSSKSINIVQDDDRIWTEYLKEASIADARLVKDWIKVIDVLLVFATLFSTVLTAFIIQIAGNSEPNPADATNKILIAIYNHTKNATAPIDLEQFLRLDDTSKEAYTFQNRMLYTSLTISMLVAALAMASKFWVVRYSREVTTSGPPRARAKRRQEVYDGLRAWKLQYCIDSLPLLSLGAVILFSLFVQSVVLGQNTFLFYFVGSASLVGISFIVIASYTAAFIPDSPYRSPLSDLVHCIYRIFDYSPFPYIIGRIYQIFGMPIRKSIPRKHTIYRPVMILIAFVLTLAVGGYFVVKRNYAYFPFIYAGIACVFALMREGRETDMRPRCIGLPLWVLISCVAGVPFVVSTRTHFHGNSAAGKVASIYVVASFVLGVMGYIGVKMSETRPMIVEAEAISWLLKTSSNKDPAWFRKAAQIAGESANARALLIKTLLPLLSPLIISLPQGDPLAPPNVTDDQKTYIITLATLMDFEPQKRSFFSNMGELNRPVLPDGLVARLESLKPTDAMKCDHKGASDNKWNAGIDRIRCPEACVGDALKHILNLHESDQNKEAEAGIQLPLAFGSCTTSLST